MRNEEAKQLHKLNRSDLVILLGKLEDELNAAEKENKRLERQIAELQSRSNDLEENRDALLKRNKKLVRMMQAYNEQQLTKNSAPNGWQEIEAFVRELSETARQTKEQVELLRKEAGRQKEIERVHRDLTEEQTVLWEPEQVKRMLTTLKKLGKNDGQAWNPQAGEPGKMDHTKDMKEYGIYESFPERKRASG